jgi:hypothetical protein
MLSRFARKTLVTEEEKKLDNLVEKSNRVIFHTTTVWPFDFFPNDLTITENQVDISIKEFFFSGHIESVRVIDIAQVSVETSFLFATLKIEIVKPQSDPMVIPYLTRADAIFARRLIYGLLSVAKEKIDTTSMDMPTLVAKLEQIGSDYEQI